MNGPIGSAFSHFFQDPPKCGAADAETAGGSGLVHIFFAKDAGDDIGLDLFKRAAQIEIKRLSVALLGFKLTLRLGLPAQDPADIRRRDPARMRALDRVF